MLNQWVVFINRKLRKPSKNSAICAKHFEEKYLKIGKRVTLIWDLNPVPTIYCLPEKIPLSVYPTTSKGRKPLSVRHPLNNQDESNLFIENDKIHFLNDLNNVNLEGYQLKIYNDKYIFFNLEVNQHLGILEVTKTILVDEFMHVSLFYKSSYLPLPPWFRNIGCVLKKKSVLENFPAYIKNYLEENSLSNGLMTELNEMKYKKPVDQPEISSNLLRYSLILRYTLAQAYKLLLEQFPLPSFSLLKKINKGGVEPLKSVKCLLNQNKIDKDVVLLMDEVYLQKEAQYQGGRMIGVDNEGILYKGVMTFMIISLKKKFNFVIRAILEVKIEGKWLADHVGECITSLQENGFHVRGVVSDNHSTNISAFSHLMHKYKNTKHVSSITHPTKKDSVIYLFFDAAHLLKNMRNKLLNSKRFIFPAFYYDQFHDVIDVHAG